MPEALEVLQVTTLRLRARKSNVILTSFRRSHVLATQLKALDEVTTLAIEDPYVRQALADVLHDSYLVPKYKERELHTLCSKAIISIKDNEVHEFWSRLSSTLHPMSEAVQQDFVRLKHQLSIYFRCVDHLRSLVSSYIYVSGRDPNVSFLLGRLFVTSMAKFLVGIGVSVFESYLEAANANHIVIEWDTLSQVITCFLVFIPPFGRRGEFASSQSKLLTQ